MLKTGGLYEEEIKKRWGAKNLEEPSSQGPTTVQQTDQDGNNSSVSIGYEIAQIGALRAAQWLSG